MGQLVYRLLNNMIQIERDTGRMMQALDQCLFTLARLFQTLRARHALRKLYALERRRQKICDRGGRIGVLVRVGSRLRCAEHDQPLKLFAEHDGRAENRGGGRTDERD